MFHELMDRFSVLAEQCARFSREVYGRAGSPPQQDLERTIRRHLDLSRAIFSQHSIEALTVLHFRGATSFRDLHKALGQISPTVLVRKLTALERFGIVQRTVTGESPMDARYVLTHKGTVISRLGEPVMLYIRLAAGWFNEHPEAVKGVPVENPRP